MKIVVTDSIGIPDIYKSELKDLGADIYETLPKSEEELTQRINNAEIITANHIKIDQKIIDSAPKLKYIIIPAVGYEWVDHKYAASKSIKVINSPSYVTNAVAQHVIALIFALARKLVISNSDLRDGKWNPKLFEGFELQNKKIGLIGYGRIGKSVEKLALGIGMTVNFVNSKSSAQEIDEIIQNSDIVCLCLPLNKNTHHLIDKRRLELMGKTTYIINVSRSSIIDQKALIDHLKSNKIAGAGLDVFTGEPLSGVPSSEIVQLANMENVVATPHTAWNTSGALDRLGKEIVDNIKACLAGTPKNVVKG